MMYDDWDGHGSGWGTWFGMGVMMVVFTALVVLVVVLVLRAIPASRPPAPPAASRDHDGGPSPSAAAVTPAERVLDERFARGDIDEQEYRSRRGVLRS